MNRAGSKFSSLGIVNLNVDFESIYLNWREYIGNRDLLICSLRILEKNGNGKKISFRDSISSECISQKV